MNLYLTFHRDPSDPDDGYTHFLGDIAFSPYNLLMDNYVELDELANASGVTPLTAFATEEDADPSFSAADGLRSVEALIGAVPKAELFDAEEIVGELQRLRVDLERLQATGRAFKFGLG